MTIAFLLVTSATLVVATIALLVLGFAARGFLQRQPNVSRESPSSEVSYRTVAFVVDLGVVVTPRR